MLLRRESSFPTKAGAGVTWAECVYIYVYGGEVNTSLRGAVGTKSWYMACVSSSLCFPPRGGHQVAPQCWQGDSVISKEEMLPLDSRSLSGTQGVCPLSWAEAMGTRLSPPLLVSEPSPQSRAP